MLRSMYSGISGMRGFQTKLDVIGNNIANVNTLGFKKGRVTFQDMMSQTTRGAQAAVPGARGGINPIQVGLGSKVGSIDNIHTDGFVQNSGHGLDLAIEGNGMFAVTDGTITYYTRAGNFYFDDDGNIVNPDGYYLVDVDGNIPINIPEDAQSFSITENGTVNYVDANGDPQVAGNIGLANFSNPGGLEKVGSNLFLNSPNAGYTGLAAPDANGMGKIISNAIEMSNVDLAEEFTEMIVSQRGFQANTRIITTSDEILQELVNLKR
ncbi:flagellar basal body rod protein FlgG [Pseudogracilibacillus auburnensis]|uniref:flagellar basal body rod protein FlgG n=1 Tax=Pseudogracilibacillus auburnensis TaxID=1494959 RepID=UPI001A97569B|nr:flagellar basal body rod protein FlgG [Pseudogracilibacillus auburnensis]MBO1003801.1 flagellar basal body rod protein FlgG [Pseudogracilibacillus auburnensis]